MSLADLERRASLLQQGLLSPEEKAILREDVITQLYELGEDPFEGQRTLSGQALETGKGVARGFLGSFATLGEGLAEQADALTNFLGAEDLIDSGEDNELVRLSRDAKRSLQEKLAGDIEYRDQFMTKFGEGLGSFASFVLPGGALKLLGAPRAAMGATTLVTSGAGAGEQAQRIDRAREEGIDVTSAQEDAAILGGSIVGLSELAPVSRVLSKITKAAEPGFKKGIANKVKSALVTGGVEGVQEVAASILQDAVERGVYNEDLPFNDSLMDDFTVGGAVGAFADLAVSSAAGRARSRGDLKREKELREITEKRREELKEQVSAGQAEEARRSGLFGGMSGVSAPVDPETPQELAGLQETLDKEMTGAGLSDVKANIFHGLQNTLVNKDGQIVFGIRQRNKGEQDVRLFGGQGNVVVEDVAATPDGYVAEGVYSNATGQIFLAADALSKDGTIDQQRDEAVGILKHEQLHAMRALDLFTDAEWNLLTETVKKRNKKGTAQSYMSWANENYSDKSESVRVEEAVAEMTRDARSDPSIVTGKPRSLIQRIIDFFPKLNNFLKGRGFNSFDSLVRNIESGKIGRRERGQIRTLKNLEKERETGPRQEDFDVQRQINQEEREQDFIEDLEERESRIFPDVELDFRDPRLAERFLESSDYQLYVPDGGERPNFNYYTLNDNGSVTAYTKDPNRKSGFEQKTFKNPTLETLINWSEGAGGRPFQPTKQQRNVFLETAKGYELGTVNEDQLNTRARNLGLSEANVETIRRQAKKELQEEGFVSEDMFSRRKITEKDFSILPDGRVIKTRIPDKAEDAPILPIGDVEQGLLNLFQRSDTPTSEQLKRMLGAPVPRTIKTESGRKKKNPLDKDVKPTPMAELRKMARSGLKRSNELLWYDDFGKGMREIVGPANMAEASVVFGITSQQNSAEQNLADTLHIMALAREYDPVKEKGKFVQQLKIGKRPGGQGLKVTNDQINRITRLYNEGFAEAGLKTSTYMQMIQDRANNIFNPFSVQDVHMARVFGFKRKKLDPDTNAVVDDSKIPTDNAYRYAQFLTSKLAQEFDVSPNQMQAALWFYAKQNLSPQKGEQKDGAGTWDAAKAKSFKEIDRINELVKKGVFNKNEGLTDSLRNPIKAANKIRTKSVGFSNILQNEQLFELARARAPRALVSSKPGNERGYGFPETVETQELIDFNSDAMDIITDETGQIPFLKDLGIPHEVEIAFGTFEGLEPNMQIRLLGGSIDQANFAANVLGDALLQDAAITTVPSFGSGSQVGIAVKKKDESNFEIEELQMIANTLNPENRADGINFTVDDSNTLTFMDERVYDDTIDYDEKLMLPDFVASMKEKLPSSMEFDIYIFHQEGEYHDSGGYKENIRKYGSKGVAAQRFDLYERIEDTLYKPFWNHYTKAVERFGFEPKNKERPTIEDLGSVGEEGFFVNIADKDSLTRRRSLTQKVARQESKIEKVVKKNTEDAEKGGSVIPRFSDKADPEAQYIAQNPDQGLDPDPNLTDMFSRRKRPDMSYEAGQVVDRIVKRPAPRKTPGQTYLENTDQGTIGYMLTKFKQAAINKYARLEQYSRDPMFKDNLADTSAIAAAYFADRSMGITASALKSGTVSYENGITRVVDFFHNGKKYSGLIDVMAPLYDNQYNVSLEDLAQSYAIARRTEDKVITRPDGSKEVIKGLRSRGIDSPVKEGDLERLEAEIDKYTNAEGNSIVREWYDVWQAYNGQTVKFLKSTGVIDDAKAQEWLELSDYIPFYRQAEAKEGEIVNLGSNVPVMFKQNMTTAIKLTPIRGSEKSINVPMLDAITRNLSMAIDAGMKNVAQQRIVRDMIKIGVATKATPAQKKNKTQNFVVDFKVNGVDQSYVIADPLLYESMQAVTDKSGIITEAFGIPSRFLRELVTRDPGFMLANMMRDTLSAYVTSGADFTPVIDTVANIGSDIDQLERFGVVGGYDFSNDPDDMVKAFAEHSRKRGININGSSESFVLKPFKAIWNTLGQGTTISDAATRKAVYNDVLARTGNEAEAAFQALEVINFSRRGRSPLFRFLTTAIPFLNARFQGLDVLYRGFMGYNPAQRGLTRGEAVRTALTRGSLITASTLMYWLLTSDDEEYKKATDEQRDLNWLIPTGTGVPIRIPVPFEVGLIFKTIPERIFDTYPVAEVFGKTGQTTKRELTESVTRGVVSTLEINPFCMQLFAPIAEASLNYNFFTGGPVVPVYTSNNAIAGLLSRESNTEISKFIGKALNISPIKVDHVLYGYTGTIGSYILDSVDQFVLKNPKVTGDPTSAAPAMTMSDFPIMKRFLLNKFSSGDQQDFYRLRTAVQQFSQ